MGTLIDRTHRELTPEDMDRIVNTYHAWRGDGALDRGPYEDVPWFCYSATLDKIRGHDYVLTPGRYVGIEEIEGDGEPFGEKIEWLTTILETQFAESERLAAMIRRSYNTSDGK